MMQRLLIGKMTVEVLLKIVIENIYSVHSEKTEYLFDGGELIFCFFEEEEIGEFRFYFSDQKLIKFSEKINEEELSEYQENDKTKKTDSKDFQKKAERLQKLFVNTF